MIENIKGKYTSILFCSVLIIFALFMLPVFVFADGADSEVISTLENIPYNKVWTIKMSNKLDPNTVSSENIVVLDSLKNKVDVNVHMGKKDSEIIIEAPKGGYDIGKTYVLEVSDKVLSSRGYKLDKNIKLIFTIGNLPVIDFCKLDHSPIIEGHDFSVYMNAKIDMDVQYNAFIYDIQRDTYSNITSGYSQTINGKTPFFVKYNKKLSSGLYKLQIFVKRANVKGDKYNSKLKINYDNLYESEFKCMKSNKELISIDGNVKLVGDDYKNIEGGYSIRIGEEIVIGGMENIGGKSGNYSYKLQGYNISNIKDIKNITQYGDKLSWTPKEAGDYIFEIWVKSNESEADIKSGKANLETNKGNEEAENTNIVDKPYDAKKFIYIKVINEKIEYVNYDITLDEFVELQGTRGWGEQYVNGRWRKANKEVVEYYINPENFIHDELGKYQFLKLNYVEGLTVEDLNMFLQGAGILEGKGTAFLQAGKKNNVNPAYLIVHALLESGYGKSKLATGVLVSSVNGKAVEPKLTYNMYGIKAYNSNPIKYGSEYAYDQGWFTPEKAIIGGQTFIGENYINSEKYNQNTLYKMRWNYEYLNHQYATDVKWVFSQTKRLKELLDKSKKAFLVFEIPVFKKDN